MHRSTRCVIGICPGRICSAALQYIKLQLSRDNQCIWWGSLQTLESSQFSTVDKYSISRQRDEREEAEVTIKRQQRRTLEQVAYEDYLWPLDDPAHLVNGPNPNESRRHRALAEVLCTMSNGDYARLLKASLTFDWFIPQPWQRACVQPVGHVVTEKPTKGLTRCYARILYLSPQLEAAAWDVLLAIVAHEVAHIVLGHQLIGNDAVYDAQEEEAFQTICAWGFEEEAKKHRRVGRWRDSWIRRTAKG